MQRLNTVQIFHFSGKNTDHCWHFYLIELLDRNRLYQRIWPTKMCRCQEFVGGCPDRLFDFVTSCTKDNYKMSSTKIKFNKTKQIQFAKIKNNLPKFEAKCSQTLSSKYWMRFAKFLHWKDSSHPFDSSDNYRLRTWSWCDSLYKSPLRSTHKKTVVTHVFDSKAQVALVTYCSCLKGCFQVRKIH